MSHGRIDPHQYEKLVDQDKKPHEIAKYFSVSRAAVCQYEKKRKFDLTTAAAGSAVHVLKSQMSVKDQIAEGKDTIYTLFRAQQLINEDGTVNEDANPNLAIRASAEFRKYIELELKIHEVVTATDQINRYQQAVEDTLAEVSPQLQSDFLARVKRRGIRRSSLRM